MLERWKEEAIGVCGAVKAARRTEEENMSFPRDRKESRIRRCRNIEWWLRRLSLVLAKQGPAASFNRREVAARDAPNFAAERTPSLHRFLFISEYSNQTSI